MVIGLQVDLKGIDAINHEMQRLVRQGQNIAKVHQKIGAIMESRVQMRFDTKTDPLHHKWAAHSASTIANYARLDTDKKGKHSKRGSLLERTRTMRDSLSFVASFDNVTVGFGVPYAAYHEYGTRKMPRRGLMMDDPTAGTLSSYDEDVILNILIKHFSL